MRHGDVSGQVRFAMTLIPSAAQQPSNCLSPYEVPFCRIAFSFACRAQCESRLTTRNMQQARHRPLNEHVHVGRHATCRMRAWLQVAICCA